MQNLGRIFRALISLKSDRSCTDLMSSNFASFGGEIMIASLCNNNSNRNTDNIINVAFLNAVILQSYVFAIGLTTRFFLTAEIIIWSFNNNALKK